MEHKNVIASVSDLDEEKGIVVVAANAIGNIDAHKDISLPGSFTKTLSENFKRVKWFKNHNQNELIGVPIEGSEDGNYLKIKGKINLDKELGRDIYADYKLYAEFGRTLEHSIGVDAIKKETKNGIRNVSEWKLWEYSTLTNWGANENTPMLSMKAAYTQEDLVSEIEWLEIKLRKGDFTDNKFIQIESQLKSLKTLVMKPSNDTSKTQPLTTIIAAIDTFNKSLKH